ncbi:hypothetical protein HLPR_12190 [Helicovermis profundi]|uniref:Uncharacterized protein n=1 Tax=Helicovermis profundi TaxID=3065157 RepID=A0AAU9E683_9FIRM|nr:hypothetical protein HLPR_12190 [Clostridia bacterium S502]
MIPVKDITKYKFLGLPKFNSLSKDLAVRLTNRKLCLLMFAQLGNEFPIKNQQNINF